MGSSFIRAKQGTQMKDGSQALLSAEIRGKLSGNKSVPAQGLGSNLRKNAGEVHKDLLLTFFAGEL